MDLAKRLYKTILEKFKGDKIKAIIYLQDKCGFYARKANSKFGTPYHAKWHAIYRAYSSAKFKMSYYYDLNNSSDNSYDPYDPF